MSQLPGFRVSPIDVAGALRPVQNAFTDYRNAMNQETRRNDLLEQQEYSRQEDVKRQAINNERYADSQAHRDRQFRLQQSQHGLQQRRAGLQEKQYGLQNEKLTDERKQRRLKGALGLVNMIEGVADPGQKSALYQRMLEADPDLASNVGDLDVDQGLAWIKARAGGGESTDIQKRTALAAQHGLDPNSPEGRTYILTGKLPMPKAAQGKSDRDLAANISAGLDNLAGVPRFAGDSFTSAVGPLQGDDEGGLATGIARVFGAIGNTFGDRGTTEIRNRIAGDTEALAAAIKPLIRKPGEGSWTDSDQKRLVAVVGDLAMARDEADYRRRLDAIRQRVRANFGIDLPPIRGGPADTDGAPARLPPGYSIRRLD